MLFIPEPNRERGRGCLRAFSCKLEAISGNRTLAFNPALDISAAVTVLQTQRGDGSNRSTSTVCDTFHSSAKAKGPAIALSVASSSPEPRGRIMAEKGPSEGEQRSSIASLEDSVGSPDSSLGAASVLYSETSRRQSLGSRLDCGGCYQETWLVQEFCDKGSLMEGLGSGMFKQRGSTRGDVNLVGKPHEWCAFV